MKRMISFIRGVKSAYVLPQKGETVIGLLWRFLVKELKFWFAVTVIKTYCA